MTRLAEIETVALNRARLESLVAPGVATETVSGAFGALVEAVLRPFQRRAIVRRLERLDDRMLDDIGLQRWEIDSVATSVAGRRAPTLTVALVDLFAAVAKGIVARRERRMAERELRNLDDRMLRDIGISRSDIPEVAAGRPISAKAEDASDALEGLRRWIRSRAAAKELNTLDSRTLNDIGMVRGDIDWVAEELALRSLRPANTNHASRVA
ncbi:MAG: DUF1127 domain-containing protein [Dongiaceae bacterium]